MNGSCKIVSLSGTPLPSTTTVDEESEYKALLKFLSIEQRKAGGVFQRYLEDKKDQVNYTYIYSVLCIYSTILL